MFVVSGGRLKTTTRRRSDPEVGGYVTSGADTGACFSVSL